MLLDKRFQSFVENMSVDLCRRNICVAQHLLYRSQICTMRQQMRGECVTQNMG